MKITDEMRSMMASVLIGSANCDTGRHCCMCCGPDARAICAMIVGEEHADALELYASEELGCGWITDQMPPSLQLEQTYLDKISELREIGVDVDWAAFYGSTVGTAAT